MAGETRDGADSRADAVQKRRRLRSLENVRGQEFFAGENGTGARHLAGVRTDAPRPLRFKLPRNREARSLILAQSRSGISEEARGGVRLEQAPESARQHGRYALRRNRKRIRYSDEGVSGSFSVSTGSESSTLGLHDHREWQRRRNVKKWSNGVAQHSTSRRSRARWSSSDSSYEPGALTRGRERRGLQKGSDVVDDECTSSDEVNAMFAEAEERELAEEKELEKEMEREHIVVSSSDSSADVSEDTDDDDFKYLEPRRSKNRKSTVLSSDRQRYFEQRASPFGKSSVKEPQPVRERVNLRKSTSAAANAALSTDLLRNGHRRMNIADSDSDSDAGDLDEFAWSQRERRRLISAQNNIQPVNMDLGGTASGGLAGRSPFRNSSAPTAGNGVLEPVKIDSSLDWEQIGGLDDYIRSLKEMIVLPLVYPEVFEQFKLEPPKGVLFHGPPGTGKTLMARALAAACSAGTRTPVAFFMRNGADCLSKWVGEAERQLRLTFDAAKARQPAIIFFDEIDGLAPVRSSKQDQIHSSIVSTLLGLMDGLDSRGRIVVIGATNRIDAVDPALRRPGRFDREFVFSLPNTQARRQILEIHTRTWNRRPSTELLDRLAKDTVGYCGADLKALCSEAALQALRRRYPQIYRSAEKLLIDPQQVQVGEGDFIQAMSLVVPTAHRSMRIHGRPLDRDQSLLLRDQLEQTLRLIGRMNERSLSGRGGRFLIHGARGNGQTILGQALLQEMEDRVLYALDLPSLLADPSTRSAEESLVMILREAARTPSAVIFIPHLELWAGPNREMLRTILLVGLRDLRRDAALFVYATADEDLSSLLPNSAIDEHPEETESLLLDLAEIVHYFAAEADAAYKVDAPPPQTRARLFEPLISEAAAPVRHDRDNGCSTPGSDNGGEELPIVPLPEYPLGCPQERERLIQRENRVLRELRLIMRDFVERLLSDRKYKPFWNRVSESEAPDYYEIVKDPMDLSEVLERVNRHEIQTMQDFIAAFELLTRNALLYNPQDDAKGIRIRSKAIALLDIVHRWAELLMDPEENEEESAIIAECASIAERRRRESSKQQSIRRQTRSFGSDGLVSFSEASRLVTQSRRHSRSREKGENPKGDLLPENSAAGDYAESVSLTDGVPQQSISSLVNSTEIEPPSGQDTRGEHSYTQDECLDSGITEHAHHLMAFQIPGHRSDTVGEAQCGVRRGDIVESEFESQQKSSENNLQTARPSLLTTDETSRSCSNDALPQCDPFVTGSARYPDQKCNVIGGISECGSNGLQWIIPEASRIAAALDAVVNATAGLSVEDLLRVHERLVYCVRRTHAQTRDRDLVLKSVIQIAKSCHCRETLHELWLSQAGI